MPKSMILPPFPSKSRGYHLQFQAGYFTDEDVDSWVKKHQYPDGYVVSAPIDCSNHYSVILKFQQTFRWWNYHANDTAGLFVGVSTDSIHWHEWDVRHDIKTATDMLIPLNEEIDISKWAANQPKVFLRFYWKGLEAWYWMVDDISLSEAFKKDIGIARLISQNESGNNFTAHDSLTLSIKNYGSETINEKIKIDASLDSKALQPMIIDASSNPITSGDERQVSFLNINLAERPLHKVAFSIHLNGDENSSNDSLVQTISKDSSSLGRLDSWNKIDNRIELTSGITKLKIIFYK